jgi:hypothetical protein
LVLYFLLVSGDTFLRRIVEILPKFSDKRQAVDISQQIQQDVSAYLVTITAMNAAVGIATAAAMYFNLVYRDFTRVGGGKTPDAKTMGRWGLAVDPDTIKQIHDRIVQIAQQQGVTQGRRMRVDTTVVETNIHHPTDSTLLGDGVRVLIRTMKKIIAITGVVGTKLRDRSRSVKLRLLDISRIARAKGQLNHERLP